MKLKKLLALLLCLVMCVSLFPASAFAEDGAEPPAVTEAEAETPADEAVPAEAPAEEAAEAATEAAEETVTEEAPLLDGGFTAAPYPAYISVSESTLDFTDVSIKEPVYRSITFTAVYSSAERGQVKEVTVWFASSFALSSVTLTAENGFTGTLSYSQYSAAATYELLTIEVTGVDGTSVDYYGPASPYFKDSSYALYQVTGAVANTSYTILTDYTGNEVPEIERYYFSGGTDELGAYYATISSIVVDVDYMYSMAAATATINGTDYAMTKTGPRSFELRLNNPEFYDRENSFTYIEVQTASGLTVGEIVPTTLENSRFRVINDTPTNDVIIPLTLGTSATGSAPDHSYAYFSFTPADSGYYSLASVNAGDTMATLFDENWAKLAFNDDADSGNRNFGIEWYMEAGHTYYLQTCFYMYYSSPTGEIPVLVTVAPHIEVLDISFTPSVLDVTASEFTEFSTECSLVLAPDSNVTEAVIILRNQRNMTRYIYLYPDPADPALLSATEFFNSYAPTAVWQIESITMDPGTGHEWACYGAAYSNPDSVSPTRLLPDALGGVTLETINRGTADITPPVLNDIYTNIDSNGNVKNSEGLWVYLSTGDDISGVEFALLEYSRGDDLNAWRYLNFSNGVSAETSFDITKNTEYVITSVQVFDAAGNSALYLTPGNPNYEYTDADHQLDLEENEYRFTVIIDSPAVARIDDVSYTSLSEALSAASEGNTVILLQDIGNVDYVTVKDGVTLDLNGHRLVDMKLLYVTGSLIDSGDTKGAFSAGAYYMNYCQSEELPVYNSNTGTYSLYRMAFYSYDYSASKHIFGFDYTSDVIAATNLMKSDSSKGRVLAMVSASWTEGEGAGEKVLTKTFTFTSTAMGEYLKAPLSNAFSISIGGIHGVTAQPKFVVLDANGGIMFTFAGPVWEIP